MTGVHFGANETDHDHGAAANESNWVQAHEALSRLAKSRALADAEEGRWLLAALRSAAHVHLGFGSFAEYVARLFGYKPRSTYEKLRVAEALEALPALARALEEGELNWSGVRELTRVAIAETEQEWLEVARGKTVHQLEALAAGKSLGDTPASSSRSSVRRHVLRFDGAPETLALWREAMEKLRRDSGTRLDDDSALMLMARHVLGGPVDEGRASYQVALSVCPDCGAGFQHPNGEVVPVGPELVEMAECDGQHLGTVAGPHVGEHRDAQFARAHTHNAAHTGNGRVGTRARQAVSKATRRTVLHRDRQCCAVPGCQNARFLDVHHLKLRSEGGNHGADNLITMCGVHHRAVHHGKLTVEGDASTGVRFAHADGNEYGRTMDPQRVEAHAKAFAALRNLGFRESEIRRALAELASSADARHLDPENVLRDALSRLVA